MADFLIPECLTNIFSYFESDPLTLHSFILVNRHWCSYAVPMLWRRTFYLIPRDYFASKRSCRLISTYLSCMSLYLDASNAIVSNKSPLVTPAFDYPSFLRGFDYAQVFHAIENWYKFQSLEKKKSIRFTEIAGMDVDTCKILSTAIELIKYILIRSPAIDYLALDTEAKYILRGPPWIALDIEATILTEFISSEKCQIKNCLSYIRKFVCHGNSNKISLYKALAKVATVVENIKIYGIGNDDVQAEELSSLIRKQRFLRKFVLCEGKKKQMFNVIKALSVNSGKLKYLVFEDCVFENLRPLELLANACSELATLKFIQCGKITCYTIPSSSFTNLNTLELQGTYFPTKVLKTLFCNENINLRTINITANFKDGMSLLDSLFRTCTRLESILESVIIEGQRPDRPFIFTNDALDNLWINLCDEFIPASLKKFVFTTDCAFTDSTIDTFLSSCKAKLNKLVFISYGKICQHSNVIKKFAKGHGLEIIEEIVSNIESSMSELSHVNVTFE